MFCNSYLKVRFNNKIGVYPNVHIYTSDFKVAFSGTRLKQILKNFETLLKKYLKLDISLSK